MGRISDFLRPRLRQGRLNVGQVVVSPELSICHADDQARQDISPLTNPHDAIEIARYDDSGIYRPLKTAPNLRHGWRLDLGALDEVVLALNFLYPAALANAMALEKELLQPVSLRATLTRQTGMYAVVKKLTSEQAQGLQRDFCGGSPGCLREIYWPIETEAPALNPAFTESEGTLALPCAEACNLFIGAGRKVIKGGD